MRVVVSGWKSLLIPGFRWVASREDVPYRDFSVSNETQKSLDLNEFGIFKQVHSTYLSALRRGLRKIEV